MTVSYTLALVADAARAFVKWATLSSVAADPNAKYVLESSDAALPNSVVLTAGSGVTLTPGAGTLTVAAVGTAAPTTLYPVVEMVNALTPYVLDTANQTSGNLITPTNAGTMMGIKFYWGTGGTALTVQAQLWQSGSSVASGTVAVSAGGIYTATFSSPYTIPAANLGKPYVISIWETSGTYYTAYPVAFSNVPPPGLPFIASAYHMLGAVGSTTLATVFGLYAGGNNVPTSVAVSEKYILEPVWA